MDARAVDAGKKVSADFQYDSQTRTSNTLAGHALARLARAEGGPALQTNVMEALFAAYFTNGEDVGDLTVLGRIADAAGMSAEAVARSASLRNEVIRLEQSIKTSGISGVPSYLADDVLLFSGARSVEDYVEALIGARGSG
jgi:predicted DsbA family dithiol-disulfide isomerase